MNLVMIMELYK